MNGVCRDSVAIQSYRNEVTKDSLHVAWSYYLCGEGSEKARDSCTCFHGEEMK